MSLDYAILGFLSERPRSGYDLKTRCFDSDVRPLWAADQAQIYRTLDRLQRSDLVTAKRRRQTGRPDRKIYEITVTGRERLADWLASNVPLPPARDPFFLQLHFGTSLPDESLLGVLTARRDAHQSQLESLRIHAGRLATQDTLSARTMTLRQTALDGAIARERSAIDWLDDCIDAVTHGALPETDASGTDRRHVWGS